jgi:guanylate kinase
LSYSISATTRAPRPGEVDGRDYRFLADDEFAALVAGGGFLETFDVYGHRYGTLRQPVEEALSSGRDIVLEIDVQGALAVRDQVPDALLVFVRAPSRDEQRRRLLERGQDDPAAVARRLAEADAEEAQASRFDAVVVNDDLDRAVGEVAAILGARRDG